MTMNTIHIYTQLWHHHAEYMRTYPHKGTYHTEVTLVVKQIIFIILKPSMKNLSFAPKILYK